MHAQLATELCNLSPQVLPPSQNTCSHVIARATAGCWVLGICALAHFWRSWFLGVWFVCCQLNKPPASVLGLLEPSIEGHPWVRKSDGIKGNRAIHTFINKHLCHCLARMGLISFKNQPYRLSPWCLNFSPAVFNRKCPHLETDLSRAHHRGE